MNIFAITAPAVIKFFEELRAGGIMRFDSNPLVEVYMLRNNIYSILSLSPGVGGDAWMHLLIGSEKALLIDTGFGIGDLKALTKELTDKPVIVANTHAHGDHTLGNFQFDEVYCHRLDEDSLYAQMRPDARRFVTTGDKAYFKPENVVERREYMLKPVEHGYVFNLGGGHEVELFHLPGHSPGGCGFIDKKNRILFSGDAIVSSPTIVCGLKQEGENGWAYTVTAFRDRVCELEKRMSEFDTLFPGHGVLDYPAAVVTDMAKLCREVVEDPNCQDGYGTAMGTTPVKFKQVGLASLAYTDERV